MWHLGSFRGHHRVIRPSGSCMGCGMRASLWISCSKCSSYSYSGVWEHYPGARSFSQKILLRLWYRNHVSKDRPSTLSLRVILTLSSNSTTSRIIEDHYCLSTMRIRLMEWLVLSRHNRTLLAIRAFWYASLSFGKHRWISESSTNFCERERKLSPATPHRIMRVRMRSSPTKPLSKHFNNRLAFDRLKERFN